MPTVFYTRFFGIRQQDYIPNKRLAGISRLNLQNFLYLNVKEVTIIIFTKIVQIFLWIFPVCVPNTVDNDVMYFTRAERYHLWH